MFKTWDNCLAGPESDIPTLACVFPLFDNLITAAFVFAGATALIFIIFAAIKLIRSAGDQKQVQSARQTMTYAIIGLVLIFLSFFIINTIAFITGAECIKSFGFNTCGGAVGQYGCFEVSGTKACYPYSENNDPQTPTGGWFSSEADCAVACK
ncbi:MAG: hypothetical protein QG600_382 [Patescibacteria group bacterium]|nr:hypothetical protein [Patescibacteria group bacterium]